MAFPSQTPTHLQRYLSDHLVTALSHAPNDIDVLDAALARVYALFEGNTSHLPYLVSANVARQPVRGQPFGEFISGTLLFADVSGFTAMSEKLSQIGREGAEEVTGIVNRYFTRMLNILDEYGGQCMRFGGDALLGFFAEPPEGSASRATYAALLMQEAMNEFAQTVTSQGTFPLRMKVAVHSGRFFAAQLGTAQKMEYALFGEDVNATAATESAASAGQVLVSATTRRRLPPSTQAVPLNEEEDYFVVVQVPPPPSLRLPAVDNLLELEPTPDNLNHALAVLDALSAYLPGNLMERMAQTAGRAEMHGDHRIVAVLFVNLHGLGTLTDQLGPGHETDIIAELNTCFTQLSNIVESYGGTVNKIDLYDHGDKLLALFGAPTAHEDDAERAARAALDIQAALHARAQQSSHPISAQMGLSYGTVFAGFVGSAWRREYTVMGDNVNLAARLMSNAPLQSILISPAIRRKVSGLCDLRDFGVITLKGKKDPMQTFVMERLSDQPTHQHNVHVSRSPLVGRQAEWATLLALTNQPERGHVVHVIGDAGLGKSRLVAELRQHVQALHTFQWIESRCLSYTETVSYYPFLSLFRDWLGVPAEGHETTRLQALRTALHQRLPDAETQLPYLANFLGLKTEHTALKDLDAEALQRRTFVAVRTVLEAELAQHPVMLALDDLHWVDPASLALLDYLLPLVERGPLTFILMYRPDRERSIWQLHDKTARELLGRNYALELHPLTDADSNQLLGNLAEGAEFPTEVRDRVVARAEGNPLYIEEVVRTLIDQNTLVRDANGQWRVQTATFTVPDTLEGVIMSRLDQLGVLPRRTAQSAAVIGRVFEHAPLTHIMEEPERTVHASLNELVSVEVVRPEPRPATYAFRHGLIQEVSYNNLLARTRRENHRALAEYYEQTYRNEPGEAALVAFHAFHGQAWELALTYELLAGQQAKALFANQAALDHFAKALACLPHLAHSASPDTELAIHLALGELYVATSQYDPAENHLHTALAVAQRLSQPLLVAQACRWLARVFELRGDYPTTLEWVNKGLQATPHQPNPEEAELRITAGLAYTRLGQMDKAQAEAARAQTLAAQAHKDAVVARALNLLGLVARNRGEHALSAQHFQNSLHIGQSIGDLYGQAWANNQLANARFNLGQWTEADHHYRQARALFDQLGNRYGASFADNNLGGIALNQGRLEDALAYYRSALHTQEQIGGSAYVLGVIQMNLGATYAKQGETTRALDHLSNSRTLFEQNQARDFLPELHRHWAEVYLHQRAWEHATAHLNQALALARELSARSEEGVALRVRAEMALAQNQPAAALADLHASEQALTEANETYELARTRLTLAELHWQLGQRMAAQTALDQCLPVFAQLDALPDLRRAEAVRAVLIA